MIETNRFQILNPDILKIIYDYGEDLFIQITYMRKEMRRSTVLLTPPYYLKWLYMCYLSGANVLEAISQLSVKVVVNVLFL